jgi:hypothetical protein
VLAAADRIGWLPVRVPARALDARAADALGDAAAAAAGRAEARRLADRYRLGHLLAVADRGSGPAD